MDNGKTIDVTTAVIDLREGLVSVINGSGLPATISVMVVKEIMEAVNAKAMEEYQAAREKRGAGKEGS